MMGGKRCKWLKLVGTGCPYEPGGRGFESCRARQIE